MRFRHFLIFLLVLSGTTALKGQKVHHAFRNTRPNSVRIAQIARLQTKLMEKRMKLSSVQSEQVNSINSDYLNKITDLQSNTYLNMDDKIKQLNLFRENKISALKQVLDETQFKEYLKLHKELQDQRSKRIQEEDPEEISKDE